MVKEILDLTKEKTIAVIAKGYLEIGEKRTREGLKKAGCEYNQREGWQFVGDDESNLEKSIYIFSPISQPRSPVTTEVKKEKIKMENNEEIKRKRASFMIDAQVWKDLKIKAAIEEKNIYELVEDVLRDYLKK